MVPSPVDLEDAEIKKSLENTKSLLLYAGIPNGADDIESFKKNGGKIIFFLSSAEKNQYTLKHDEAGVTWDDDQYVHNWLLTNVSTWLGGQIGGNTEERAGKLAGVIIPVIELHNFDVTSLKFLNKDNTPTKNALRNYRWVEDGIPLSRAKGKAKGHVGVLIAAGPSLNAQWKELLRLRNLNIPLMVFVVGRSYKAAMKAGLEPDIVVEVEQFDWDDAIFSFAPEPPQDTILAGPLSACPGVFQKWPRNKMIMMDHTTAQMFGLKIGEDSLDGGNSIIHHMFNLAVFMGCDTICLAGVDFSYPKGSTDTHADGTFPSWPKSILAQEHTHQDPHDVPCTSGGNVKASKPYQNFCTFLQIQIHNAKKANAKLEVINFSPHGQLIKGTTFKDIATWNGPSSLVPPSSPVLSVSSPGPASLPLGLSPMPFSSDGITPVSPVFDTTLTRQGEIPLSESVVKPS
jgi:hypothetical protein